MIPFRSFHLTKKKIIKDYGFRSTITDDLNNSLVTKLISTSLISTIYKPQANNYIDFKINLVSKAKGDQRFVCGRSNTNNECQQAFLCRNRKGCASYRMQWPG